MTETTANNYRIECVHLGFGLFVESGKQNDRFGHQIGLFDGHAKRPLLSSIEGTDVDFWPASPPLQQVYQQEIEQDPVILAVGMAGKNHYSMSARLIHAQNTVELKLESACLVNERQPNIFLGNTYQLASGILVRTNDQGVVLLDSKTESLLAIIRCEPSTSAEILSEHEIRFMPTPDLHSEASEIQPSGSAREKPTQWNYIIQVQVQS